MTPISIIDAFEWTGNSHQMFDKVCESTPWLFRKLTRNALTKGLKDLYGDDDNAIVTEQGMYDVCKEVTPSAHLAKRIALLDEHSSTVTDAKSLN